MIHKEAGHAYQVLSGELTASDADEAETKVHAAARDYFGGRAFRIERMTVSPSMVSSTGKVLAYGVDYAVRERGAGP